MSDMLSWANTNPEKTALFEAASQRSITYADLKKHALQLAAWFQKSGLVPGDGVAFLLDNQIEMIEIGMGARHAGLYYTAIGNHLTAEEVLYITQDSGAKVLFINSATIKNIESIIPTLKEEHKVTIQYIGAIDELANEQATDIVSYQKTLEEQSHYQAIQAAPLMGRDLLYSSGTTGRPKGIRKSLVIRTDPHQQDSEVAPWQKNFGFNENSVYLTTAPMYHAAPFRYIMRTLDVGGTCIIMKKFEPELSLSLIEQHQVTHSQWVPTMFVRLLRLPEETKKTYDLSSMRMAIHAAAPCPIEVKRAMLEWWGDIIYEYYAGSEGIGTTLITPQEWWQHQGSVGRITVGKIHILDDNDEELPVKEIGRVYFSGTGSFNYLNDPEKTKEAFNSKGWATYGDIGYLDEEGFLYLCDRRSDLILAGGVNVYPQEIENVLINHPSVEDVAVIGVPNEDFGEVPKAIISLRNPELAGEELAKELILFCREKLSRIKIPKTIVFREEMPRMDSGKLSRKLLKNEYRNNPEQGFDSREIFQNT